MTTKEDLKYARKNQPLTNSEAVQIVRGIPVDWPFISGEFHVPFDEIQKGKVAFGRIWNVKGKPLDVVEMGNDGNDYVPFWCSCLSQDRCVYGSRKEMDLGGGRLIHGNTFDIINHRRVPCGYVFNNAHVLDSTVDQSQVRDNVVKVLGLGYMPTEMSALSGMHVHMGGPLSTNHNWPNRSNAPESFDVYNDFDMKSLSAFVSYDEEKGGEYKKVDGLINLLRQLNFKRVIE